MSGSVQRRELVVAWAFVVVQFALLAVLVVAGGDDDWPVPGWLDVVGALAMVAGLVIVVLAALGLGRGLTAAPLPNERAELRTGGAYRVVRHPIYSGLLLFVLAHTVVSASWLQVVVCLLLVALLTAKARWEEQRLQARFPGYAAYAARTARFVPGLRPGRPGNQPKG